MKKWHLIPICTLLIAVVVALFTVFGSSAPGVRASHEFVSLSIDNNHIPTELPDNPNEVTEYPGDLSGENWAGQVGLELSAAELPPNVSVLGQPLLEGTLRAEMDMTRGCFSFVKDDTTLFDAFPRMKMGNQYSYLNSVVKVPKYDKLLDAVDISYNGTNISWLDVAVDYSYGIEAAENKDNYSFKLSVTAPVDTLPFSYQYVILAYPPITKIRFVQAYENRPGLTTYKDVNISSNSKSDLPLDIYPAMLFLDESDNVITAYNFGDLMLTCIGLDYDNSKTVVDGSNQMSFTLSFDYPALQAGETFYNDGYFGEETTYSSYPSLNDNLYASRVQNDVATGTVTKVEVYVASGATGDVRLGIYLDDGGSNPYYFPGTLLEDGGAVAVSNGWCPITGMDASVTLNDYYWLCFNLELDGPYIYYNQFGGVGYVLYSARSYAYGALPNPFGTVTEYYDTVRYCLRAYVEVGGPEITVSPSSRGFGVLYHSQTYWSYNTTLGYSPSWPLSSGECYAYLENTGTAAGVVTANVTDLTGGITINLTDAAPGTTSARLSLFKAGDGSSDNVTIIPGSGRTFLASMASGNVTYFDIRLEWCTGYENDANEKTSVIYFTISAI